MYLTTQNRILEYLRRKHSATVRELSRVLGLSGADIRHHISVLEMNGLIRVIDEQHRGRGRPVRIYGLSRQVSGDGLEWLSRSMLGEIQAGSSPANADKMLKLVAERMAAVAGFAKPSPQGLLSHRLSEAIANLNRMKYQSRWEAGMEGPTVILGYCPYSPILDEHPELCRIDKYLLEAALGVPVEQKARLQPVPGGLSFCKFAIQGS